MHEIKDIMERLEGFAKMETNKEMECIDTAELGQVIDMIKDCSMSLYYYTIYKQMKDKETFDKYGNQTMFMESDADIKMMYDNTPRVNEYSIAKRKYTEPNDNTKKIRNDKLNDYLDDIEGELKNQLMGMWADEKQVLKNRLLKWANMQL